MKKRELSELIDVLAVRLARLEDDVRALQWKVASLLPLDAIPPQPFPQTWGIQQTGPSLSEAAAEIGKAVEEGYRQRRQEQQTLSGARAVMEQADGVDISSSSIEIDIRDLYP